MVAVGELSGFFSQYHQTPLSLPAKDGGCWQL